MKLKQQHLQILEQLKELSAVSITTATTTTILLNTLKERGIIISLAFLRKCIKELAKTNVIKLGFKGSKNAQTYFLDVEMYATVLNKITNKRGI